MKYYPASLQANIVILTILREEYNAVLDQIHDHKPIPLLDGFSDLYAWETGTVDCTRAKQPYTIAVGMIGLKGNPPSALATMDAIQCWNPRYLFYTGIAGGLLDAQCGDVVFADLIVGYEYGRLNKTYEPRSDWNYSCDFGLVNQAQAYALQSTWQERIQINPPIPYIPKAIKGNIASGDKVVENPDNLFFQQVREKSPKLNAVEMEGLGASAGIKDAYAKGKAVGFIMIRGISDVPPGGKPEREEWKVYASAAAAAFTIGFIANGLTESPPQSSGVDRRTTLSHDLINALLRCGIMQTTQGRNTIVRDLPLDIQQSIDRSGRPDMDISSIVNGCLGYSEGLEELVKAMSFFENNSIPMQEVKRIVSVLSE
jgi:nucleoside phosphorylase